MSGKIGQKGPDEPIGVEFGRADLILEKEPAGIGCYDHSSMTWDQDMNVRDLWLMG